MYATSAGAPARSLRRRSSGTGLNADTTTKLAVEIAARSAAVRTALDAVTDPSVPTTMFVYIGPPESAMPAHTQRRDEPYPQSLLQDARGVPDTRLRVPTGLRPRWRVDDQA